MDLLDLFKKGQRGKKVHLQQQKTTCLCQNRGYFSAQYWSKGYLFSDRDQACISTQTGSPMPRIYHAYYLKRYPPESSG